MIPADDAVMVPRGALRWLLSDSTGLSSMNIWAVMVGVPCYVRKFSPLDAHDFGRCVFLLDYVPQWRCRIGEMAAVSPEWAALVVIWDELEALYRAGNRKRCRERIQAATEAALAAKGG